jgi:hypothetical protein
MQLAVKQPCGNTQAPGVNAPRQALQHFMACLNRLSKEAAHAELDGSEGEPSAPSSSQCCGM